MLGITTRNHLLAFIVLLAGAFGAGLGCGSGTKKKAAAPSVSTQPARPTAATADVAPTAPAQEVERDRCREPLVGRPIYFAFDSYDLPLEARDQLQRIAMCLGDRAEATLRIAGHTDERGTPEYNVALAEQRAAAARDYLVRLGVDAGRIAIISYGEERPAVAGRDEESYAKNRRDELDVQGVRR
jgi:peptidoglycan-associated lipoprotein